MRGQDIATETVPGKPLLNIKDLHISFRTDSAESRVVEGLELKIAPGETVCLVGESGCGKTVTALSILGLIPQPPGDICKGSIFFNDLDLLNLPESSLQRLRGKHLSMIFQDPLTSLNPVFPVKEQIKEVLVHHEELGPKEVQEWILETLIQVNLPNPGSILSKYPHQLSGGQRQRVMIAIALVCKPSLLIADEPTTALDVTIQAQIIQLFRSLQKTGARSLLYITHDLGVVASLADLIYVMYAGIIVEKGTAKQIFYNPKHPYTQSLLASLPRFSKKGSPLQAIQGTVPHPAAKPNGCPFHPRCRYTQFSCTQEIPKLITETSGHATRCPVLAEKSFSDC
ncbi:MAG TPA: ABC transporter ATP-binding protein [Desulfohalobiaceae bacterium]|nr:ABC transporter ATP-binding protein [Desulfohalobiaceae bacterium]